MVDLAGGINNENFFRNWLMSFIKLFKKITCFFFFLNGLLKLLNEIKSRHNASGIPSKSKRVSYQHGEIQYDDGRNGEQEDFGIG